MSLFIIEVLNIFDCFLHLLVKYTILIMFYYDNIILDPYFPYSRNLFNFSF